MCRCSIPARPGSDATERTSPSACAAATTVKKRTKVLSLSSVLVDQTLKARIASQWIPNWIYFQSLCGDAAWSAQQSIEYLDRAIALTQNRVNLRYASHNFRTSKRVFGFGKQFGRALRLRERRVLLAEKCEHFCQLNVVVGIIRAALQLILERGFCFQESRSRSGVVVERFSRKADVIILAPQVSWKGGDLIVWQVLRCLQSFLILAFQEKDIRAGVRGLQFFGVTYVR